MRGSFRSLFASCVVGIVRCAGVAWCAVRAVPSACRAQCEMCVACLARTRARSFAELLCCRSFPPPLCVFLVLALPRFVRVCCVSLSSFLTVTFFCSPLLFIPAPARSHSSPPHKLVLLSFRLFTLHLRFSLLCRFSAHALCALCKCCLVCTVSRARRAQCEGGQHVKRGARLNAGNAGSGLCNAYHKRVCGGDAEGCAVRRDKDDWCEARGWK